jgi:para-aminobenzoate synthetase component 1
MADAAAVPGLDASPEAVVAAWPRDWGLAVVWGGGPGGRTIIGRAGGRAGETVVGLDGARAILAGQRAGTGSGWIGWLSYDAGRVLEPRAQGGGAEDDRGWSLASFVRIDDALVFDGATNSWSGLGAWEELAAGLHPEESPHARADLSFELAAPVSQMGRARYESAVARIIEYIRAGDVYQVNLAHRLSGAFEGSARGLFLSLTRAASPWHGAYLETVDDRGRARIVASASPELFLDFDPASRRLVTRPMKGTRRGGADPAELDRADKDRAELNMIVDLMRNDLGRICEFGSVRVERARDIERHGGEGGARQRGSETARQGRSGAGDEGGLLQATATVSGRVREGLTMADVIAAAFPGGSVTGAPKIRAMQIIDELEPVRRGPYCGCCGWIGDDGAATLNIAIRTALITGECAGPAAAPGSAVRAGRLDYSVGAGIVADSDPQAEWEETLAKAAILSSIE